MMWIIILKKLSNKISDNIILNKENIILSIKSAHEKRLGGIIKFLI